MARTEIKTENFSLYPLEGAEGLFCAPGTIVLLTLPCLQSLFMAGESFFGSKLVMSPNSDLELQKWVLNWPPKESAKMYPNFQYFET